jgi:dolichol-phosphate mannosyltransferase
VEGESAVNTLCLQRPGPVLLSVVVPCFDEEAVIQETHARLVATLARIVDTRFEVV